MMTEIYNIQTEIKASDDRKKTFEIRRIWDENGRKAVVIELYPTIAYGEGLKTDLSTMHLLNHVHELGWGEVRILNLYATVFRKRPLQEKLKEDTENVAHIERVLNELATAECDIVICWGKSLENHAVTARIKERLLEWMIEMGMENRIKHLVAETVAEEEGVGTHALYLGLRHGKERWLLKSYTVRNVLASFKGEIPEGKDNPKENTGKEKKGRSKKCTTE